MAAKIVFQSNRAVEYDIWVMNADGTNQQNLTSNTLFENNPDWSPDGTRIVFLRRTGATRDLHTIDAGGGTPFQVTNDGVFKRDPVYSPDGTKILYATNPDIWVINTDGTGLALSSSGGLMPSWQPVVSEVPAMTGIAAGLLVLLLLGGVTWMAARSRRTAWTR